jgi:hypothetical protein
MSSLLSFHSFSSIGSSSSIGVWALMVGLLLGHLSSFLHGIGVFESLALTTNKPQIGGNVLFLLD